MHDFQIWFIAVASCLALCHGMPNPEPDPEANPDVNVKVNVDVNHQPDVNVDVNVNIDAMDEGNEDDVTNWISVPPILLETALQPNETKINNKVPVLISSKNETTIEVKNITLEPSSIIYLIATTSQYIKENGNGVKGSPTQSISIETDSTQDEIKQRSNSPKITSTIPSNYTKIPKSCTCGKINKSNRIVGGQVVEKHLKYPWHVGIKSPSLGKKYFCGGTIINEKYILTAAHCFYVSKCKYDVPDDLTIGIADHDQVSQEDVIEGVTQEINDIEEITKHPKYDCNTENYDFALIKLSSPLVFTEANELRPVCLPENDEKTYESELGTVTGWGILDYDDWDQPNILNEVTLPIMDKTCGNKYGSEITPQMICTLQPGGGKDACIGDSGGPLVVNEGNNYILVGVVSWGYDCAKPRYPGVYSRVSSVLDWIKSTCADAKWCPKQNNSKGTKSKNRLNKMINSRNQRGHIKGRR